METLIAFVAGAAVALVAWPALRPAFADEVFRRQNYRGHDLPTATGIVIVLAAAAVVAVRLAVESSPTDAAALVAAAGFGFLGLFDDLVGHGHARGFRGHVRALARGEVTSGLVKLAGGAVLGLAATALVTDGSLGRLVLGSVTIALAANTANLLDRAPGRTIKATVIGFAAAVVTLRRDAGLAGIAAGIGAGAGLLPVDLREDGMLGDTGANPLGALVGLAVVAHAGLVATLAVATALSAVNLAAEWVSLGRVIDRLAPLRWLDRLGARPR